MRKIIILILLVWPNISAADQGLKISCLNLKTALYAREQSYIHWVNPYTPINHNKLGSSQSWRIEKKYKYYD